MADIANTPVAQPTPPQAQAFNIHRIFLKGTSLELPKGANAFLVTEQSTVHLDLQNNVNDLGNGNIEVTVRSTLTAKLPDQSVFYLLEADFSGIFQITGFDQDTFQQIINVNCPAIIFPYIRAFVSETLGRATLPAFILPEINWVAAWEQNKEAIQAANAEKPPVTDLH